MAEAIEKLLDVFVSQDGTAYYQVKWKPTWERADVLAQYTDLVNNFWKSINDSHFSNIYQNKTMRQKPVPDIRSASHGMNNVQQHQVGALTPQRRSNPTTPSKQTNMTPSKPGSNTHKPRTPSSSSASFPQYMAMEQNMMTAPNSQRSTVVIDSDEEVDIKHPVTQPTPEFPMQQQEHIVKTEEIDIKPFQYLQGNENMMQQQQHQQPFNFSPTHGNPNPFSFNMHSPLGNVNLSPMRGSPKMRGTRGRGGRGGRGGSSTGGSSPTKRKFGVLGSPTSNISFQPPVKMEPGTVKAEPGVDMNAQQTEEKQSLNWKDYFETLENYVDGVKVSSAYKCKVCGSTIAQLSNCARHFKIHNKDGEGEHECPICGKKFHRIDYVERHLKQHGQGTDEEKKKMIQLITLGMKKR